jgi:hypothetical protein
MSGTLGTPTLTKISDQPRAAVGTDETFKLSLKLKGSNASCKMTFLQQGNPPNEQTISATTATNQVGFIGLLTRETKASYTNAKICQVF